MVVDASVAFAAGDKVPQTTPTPAVTAYWSLHCSRFLQGMLAGGYRVVFSELLKDEWNKHQSAYSAKWRMRMTSRKLVCYVKHSEPLVKAKVLATQISKQEKSSDG
jgi:hypothetical protein